MISVSPGLKAEFQKLRGRGKNGAIKARVRIDYSDVNIDNTVTSTSSNGNPETFEEHLYNGKEDIPYKWASLDGAWTLGDYALIPSTDAEADLLEVGWWSSKVSLPDKTFENRSGNMYGAKLYGDKMYGEFQTLPSVVLNFTPRTISEINLSFDNARMEYAEEFIVTLCDIDGNVLYTNTYTGNTGTKYGTTIPTQNLVAEFRLEFVKWSHAGRAAKIAEMFTSVSDLYEGDDILNLRVSENRQVSGEGAPTGSTASGQCVITLFNRGRKFDYDNTESKLYNLVRENVRIIPEIGDGTEWVPLGVFYAKAWDIPKRGLSATATGLDRMALLDESEYDISTIIQAPADETVTIDTNANWGGGTLDGATVDGDTITIRV